MHLPRPTLRRWLPLAAALPLAAIFALPQAATSSPELARFSMFPVAKFLPCMAAPGQTPTATATVVKGDPNDTLVLSTSGFKPGLKFDLFTIQRSSQQADGSPATVPGVGMAWYQSDVNANSSVALKTVLVDQIFGFDPDVARCTPSSPGNSSPPARSASRRTPAGAGRLRPSVGDGPAADRVSRDAQWRAEMWVRELVMCGPQRRRHDESRGRRCAGGPGRR
jgi:hypothetical protein